MRVLLREPTILVGLTQHTAERLQLPTVAELGKRAIDDPLGAAPPQGFDVWSRVKAAFFPRGSALLLAVPIYLAVFLMLVRQTGMAREVALVGLVATTGFVLDAYVAVLTGGTRDLMKHLFLSNLLFDLATIALAGLATIYATRAAAGHLGRRLA
jgi:hypothetical protein